MLFYAIFFNLSIVYCSLQCMRAWAICISGIHKRHSRCGFYGQDANCKAADAPYPPPPSPNMVSLVLCRGLLLVTMCRPTDIQEETDRRERKGRPCCLGGRT